MKNRKLSRLRTAFCLSLTLLAGLLRAATPTPIADGEFTNGPDYTDAPGTIVRSEVPHGTLHRFTMDSRDSRIYPGIAKHQPGVVPYQRLVCVYIPHQ